MTVEDRHRAEARHLLIEAWAQKHADRPTKVTPEDIIATALAEAEARGAREEREVWNAELNGVVAYLSTRPEFDVARIVVKNCVAAIRSREAKE